MFNPGQLSQYHHDGFVIAPQVFPEQEVARLREH